MEDTIIICCSGMDDLIQIVIGCTLQKFNPDLFNEYHFHYSLEVHVSKLRELMEINKDRNSILTLLLGQIKTCICWMILFWFGFIIRYFFLDFSCLDAHVMRVASFLLIRLLSRILRK